MRRKRWGDVAFLGTVLVGNVVGTVFVAGLQNDEGMHSGMVVGGFLVDLMVVLGVLVAVGTTSLADAIASRMRDDRGASLARGFSVAAVALVVLVPSLIVHRDYANHRIPDLADNYARRILEKLPRDAVLVTYGWEYGTPIRYRQIVHGDRPDVVVVGNADMHTEWFPEELAEAAPDLAPPDGVDPVQYTPYVINAALDAGRPVYADMSIVGAIGPSYGLEIDGDVALVAARARRVDGRRRRRAVTRTAQRTRGRRLAHGEGRCGFRTASLP